MKKQIAILFTSSALVFFLASFVSGLSALRDPRGRKKK